LLKSIILSHKPLFSIVSAKDYANSFEKPPEVKICPILETNWSPDNPLRDSAFSAINLLIAEIVSPPPPLKPGPEAF